MKKKSKSKRTKSKKTESTENTYEVSFFRSLKIMNYLFWFIGCLIVVIVGFIKDIDWNGFTIALIPFEGLIVYGCIGWFADLVTNGKYNFLGTKQHSSFDKY